MAKPTRGGSGGGVAPPPGGVGCNQFSDQLHFLISIFFDQLHFFQNFLTNYIPTAGNTTCAHNFIFHEKNCQHPAPSGPPGLPPWAEF